MITGTSLGVRGQGVSAEVDSFGHVHVRNGGILRWVVAGDDRWYDPAREPSVRQTTRDGFPIVVTKMRVPTGDATVFAYGVVSGGEATVVVEVRNESTLPFAVVLSDPSWRTVRNPVPMHDRATQDAMLAHVQFPPESVIHPIGHQATLRFVHDPRGGFDAERINSLPTVDQVAAGWERALASSTRLNVPDHGLVKDIHSARCALLLDEVPQHDVVDQLIAVNELIRMGDKSPSSFDDVELNDYLGALEDVIRHPVADGRRRSLVQRVIRRSAVSGEEVPWYVDAMLVGSSHALHKLGQHKAAGDVVAARERLIIDSLKADANASAELPGGDDLFALSPMKRLVRVDLEFARVASPAMPGKGTDILPFLSAPRIGNPKENWLGVNFEAHGLACSRGTVGYALRWHGDRPAVLWEASEQSVLPLSSQQNDVQWHTNDLRGEVLLAAPKQ